jgi:DNA-binding MarR family transcriptional regulator
MLLIMSQDYEYDLFFMLHDVARLIRIEADKRARGHGMTRAQWGLVLCIARRPGLSQKEVADILEVEPISVARLVDRMEAGGLVERRADEQDRRIWRLHLLPAATSLLSEIKFEREALAEFVSAGVPAHIRTTMVEGLRRMKANLQHPADAQTLRAEPADQFKESA